MFLNSNKLKLIKKYKFNFLNLKEKIWFIFELDDMQIFILVNLKQACVELQDSKGNKISYCVTKHSSGILYFCLRSEYPCDAL